MTAPQALISTRTRPQGGLCCPSNIVRGAAIPQEVYTHVYASCSLIGKGARTKASHKTTCNQSCTLTPPPINFKLCATVHAKCWDIHSGPCLAFFDAPHAAETWGAMNSPPTRTPPPPRLTPPKPCGNLYIQAALRAAAHSAAFKHRKWCLPNRQPHEQGFQHQACKSHGTSTDTVLYPHSCTMP